MDLTFLRNFNNYFNRKIIKFDNYTDYTSRYTYKVFSNNVDFDPADGVNTTQIINWSEAYTPDYLLVTQQIASGSTTTTQIVSRWFVTEWKRIRGKQYNATLKRDVVTDNFSVIMNSPCYIEKATIKDKYSPLLYNKEGMTYNQIKDEDEILLTDKTGSAWIVGYMASNLLGEGDEPIEETTKDVPFKDVTLSSQGSNISSSVFPVSNEVVLSECYIIVNGETKKHGTAGVTFTFSVSTGILGWSINLGSTYANMNASIHVVFNKDAYVESDDYRMVVPGGKHRNHLEDAPYDMFCIPYGSVHLRTANINTEGAASWQIAMELTKDLGTANIYDVQLVPYCPALNMLVNGDVAEILGTQDYDYEYIIDKNNFDKKSICIWCKKSTGSFDFVKSIQVPRETSGGSYVNPEYLDYKISNETDVYRLVSPNYNGQFEFSLAKNSGIGGFNVDFTYKPQQPYIHITPWLRGLYGYDTDDARGLICGGDFSLPQISSAWTDYQVQNKNYQAMFDRDIQNMDVNNYWSSSTQALNIGLSAANKVSGIGTAGAKYGAAGALSGGINMATGLIGGLYGLNAQGEMNAENRDYAIDKFNMQLGNIQAMPWSLTKVSAFNANNKLFPFVEHYHCTDVEKNALKAKLKYDGMKVGVLTEQLSSYITYGSNEFIQGRLVRLENLSEDSHMANAIYEEILKGVYM